MLNYFPTITYNKEKIIDISKRYIIENKYKDNYNIFVVYENKNNKLPEEIAYDYYGSCDYFELILIANNITNMYDDWVKNQDELNEYIEQKYTEEKMYNIHHYHYKNKKNYLEYNFPSNQPILRMYNDYSYLTSNYLKEKINTKTDNYYIGTYLFPNLTLRSIYGLYKNENVNIEENSNIKTINFMLEYSEFNKLTQSEKNVIKNIYNEDKINFNEIEKIDNYTYEFNKNEEKRKIKVIRPSILSSIIEEISNMY